MSTTIDERVVEMRFDNRQFEQNVQTSLSTLDKLKQSLDLNGAAQGLENLGEAAKKCNMSTLSSSVEAVQGKKNSVGDDYFRLVARAYMPVSESNKELRLSIDSGITREVSVGCAVEKTLCSICGNDINSHECSHIKGETYGDVLCFGELTNPYDAYEFSFVAVPAQKQAGVIKSFAGKEKSMSDILKSIEKCEAVALSENDSKKLKSYIDSLKKQASDGVYYRNTLIGDVLKYSAVVQPEISRKTMESVTASLSIEELKEFKNAYEKKMNGDETVKPQLFVEKSERKTDLNTEFKI